MTHLAPFVRIEKNKITKQLTDELKGLVVSQEQFDNIVQSRLKKAIKDGIQTFNYQVLTLQTTNGQAPFISVFLYLGETTEYKEELAMIIEEILHQRIIGVKNKLGVYVTTSFPKLLYCLEEDNITEDSKYYYLTELADECSTKRLVPDYISEKKMKELKEGNVVAPMSCRALLSPYKDEDGEYKFYGRFNQGVCTLNLVDIALSSKKDIDLFWKLFDERTELCFRVLMKRHKRLLGTPSDVAPILWQNGAYARLKEGENIDKLLFNGYSTISLGYAGLYECVKYMTGNSHTSEIGKQLGLNIMQFMSSKCELWKKETNIGFALYGSPIESTTYKFAKCLKKRFGVIDGITDKDYITNSYHVNVKEKIDAFSKLKFESEFQSLSLGGAISYVETPNMTKNPKAVMEIIKFIYNNIAYAEINTQTSYCHVCQGKELLINDDMEWYCPNCGNKDFKKMNVAVRVCGYISTNPFNKGRTQDIKEREYHVGME